MSALSPASHPSNPPLHLLEQIDARKLTSEAVIDGWQVTPIHGGANNLLYRVSHESEPGAYAVKFTMNDPRRRAEREYRALSVLDTLGLDLAPHPVLFDETAYSLPLIVETWVEGEVIADPPDSAAAWAQLIDYYVNIHNVTCAQVCAAGMALEKPILYAESAEACKELIRQKITRLPLNAQPESLRRLYARFDARRLPHWDAPPLALARNDPNPRNFIRRGGQAWASVDWEYSGITDPAFDFADMLTHPQYIDVSSGQQARLIDEYVARMDKSGSTDTGRAARIRAYQLTMTVWWVARFAQYLYEVPLGLDERLVQRPPTWREDAERKYAHYLLAAERLLDTY